MGTAYSLVTHDLMSDRCIGSAGWSQSQLALEGFYSMSIEVESIVPDSLLGPSVANHHSGDSWRM